MTQATAIVKGPIDTLEFCAHHVVTRGAPPRERMRLIPGALEADADHPGIAERYDTVVPKACSLASKQQGA